MRDWREEVGNELDDAELRAGVKCVFLDDNPTKENRQFGEVHCFNVEVDKKPRTLIAGRKLARRIATIEDLVGKVIKITRSGEGFDTSYEVTEV